MVMRIYKQISRQLAKYDKLTYLLKVGQSNPLVMLVFVPCLCMFILIYVLLGVYLIISVECRHVYQYRSLLAKFKEFSLRISFKN